jgi:DNA-binding transcriptional regulator GbsR (MarR family)
MDGLEKEFTQFTVNVMQEMGFEPLSAKLFSIIFLEPEEISLDELVNRTGYSLPSICNKMRIMESMGLVKRVKRPGTKKVYYFAEKDFIEMMKFKINIAFEKEIKPAKEKIPAMIRKYENKKMTDIERKRFKIVKAYYDQIIKFEKILGKFMKMVDDI